MARLLSSYLPIEQPLLLLPAVLGLWIVYALIKHIYNALCGPLAKVPGPRWRALSVLPHLKACWDGNEATSVIDLHKAYGPVVRLAPDLVALIGEGQIWKTIYASKSQGVSAFPKDTIFYDKPFNEVPGPFGSEDPVSLRMRKTMAPAFSDSGLKQYEPKFKGWCIALAKRLNQCARDKEPTDMVKLFNCESHCRRALLRHAY